MENVGVPSLRFYLPSENVFCPYCTPASRSESCSSANLRFWSHWPLIPVRHISPARPYDRPTKLFSRTHVSRFPCRFPFIPLFLRCFLFVVFYNEPRFHYGVDPCGFVPRLRVRASTFMCATREQIPYNVAPLADRLQSASSFLFRTSLHLFVLPWYRRRPGNIQSEPCPAGLLLLLRCFTN